MSVETDKNGTITANTSYITVNPETVAAVAWKSKVSGKVISVTTADIVSSAEVVVRKGKDSRTVKVPPRCQLTAEITALNLKQVIIHLRFRHRVIKRIFQCLCKRSGSGKRFQYFSVTCRG